MREICVRITSTIVFPCPVRMVEPVVMVWTLSTVPVQLVIKGFTVRYRMQTLAFIMAAATVVPAVNTHLQANTLVSVRQVLLAPSANIVFVVTWIQPVISLVRMMGCVSTSMTSPSASVPQDGVGQTVLLMSISARNCRVKMVARALTHLGATRATALLILLVWTVIPFLLWAVTTTLVDMALRVHLSMAQLVVPVQPVSEESCVTCKVRHMKCVCAYTAAT